jgi:uncharacterized protein YegP (UPF0339 family)
MATATRKGPGAEPRAHRDGAVSEAAALKFLVFEDNSGDYRWTILDSAGESLAQSGGFASYDDAHEAADVVRDGARSAQFEARAV